jgi:hypothetical protein
MAYKLKINITGYTGRFCEMSLTVCYPNPCKNGGVCEYPFTYQSTCPLGLTGLNCETVIDECASNPCKSENSTCINTFLDGFKCICPPYLTGELCEQTINLCSPSPCPANIPCRQISLTETKCICPPGKFYNLQEKKFQNLLMCLFVDYYEGYTGPRCTEKFDVCASNPCGLHGRCVSPLPGLFRCNCDKGWQGTFCQQQLVLCDSISCLNDGYCVDDPLSSDLFKCICPKV